MIDLAVHPTYSDATFLAERRSGIGGSDAHHVHNCQPWGCSRWLWYEKRGTRRYHAVVPLLIGSAALGMLPFSNGNLGFTVACFMIAFVGFLILFSMIVQTFQESLKNLLKLKTGVYERFFHALYRREFSTEGSPQM